MARNVRFRFYPPKVQHFRPWKMVVGRLLSYGEGNFSGAMLNFRRVDVSRWWWKKQILGSFDPDFPGDSMQFDDLRSFFHRGCCNHKLVFFFWWKVYTICGPRFTNQGAWHFIQFRWWYDWVMSSMPHQKHARHARAGGCHVLWWGLYITNYADRDIQLVVIDTLPKTNMSPEK